MIIDEASSGWSSNKEILPDSNILKDVLDSSHIQLSLDEAEDEAKEDIAEEVLALRPWKTTVYQQQSEAHKISGRTTLQTFRSSSRIRRLNRMYGNASIVEEEDEKGPDNLEEAFEKPKWIKAMKKEIVALELNQSWELMLKPSDEKPISCKWFYKIKRHINGSIKRYKARLQPKAFLSNMD